MRSHIKPFVDMMKGGVDILRNVSILKNN